MTPEEQIAELEARNAQQARTYTGLYLRISRIERRVSDQQVRDAVGRLTWGYQSAATVLAAGVHVNALRAALVQLGRDADSEIKAAIGAKE